MPRQAPPDHIVLARDRDLEGRRTEMWARRAILVVVLALVPLLALANAFGQRPATQVATGQAATLEVYAPTRVRSGLIFQARFTVTARRTLRDAALRLDPGWLEGLSINSLEPQPREETSDDGRPLLALGRIEPGRRFTLYSYFQVNPTNVGRRAQDVELLDGAELVARVDRTFTVFP